MSFQVKNACQRFSWQTKDKTDSQRFLSNSWSWLWKYFCINHQVWHSASLFNHCNNEESWTSSSQCKQCVYWIVSQRNHLHVFFVRSESQTQLCFESSLKSLQSQASCIRLTWLLCNNAVWTWLRLMRCRLMFFDSWVKRNHVATIH